ncbi:Calx-beta domain-containing protein [Anabaena sp. UHCC 0451]|uniref:Calx-beta domain-containing protein n=1 Tax=Anabaena sp. UHCC 0451 TaxID=2055235 RepID=UPI002B20F8CB|nr:Calx-beta domain-containing protein [Anabaena sp. UHCC 0451]MEA5575244.1 Calx-beta domain-containing protein [Anabaena sp. UHCC 0451]
MSLQNKAKKTVRNIYSEIDLSSIETIFKSIPKVNGQILTRNNTSLSSLLNSSLNTPSLKANKPDTESKSLLTYNPSSFTPQGNQGSSFLSVISTNNGLSGFVYGFHQLDQTGVGQTIFIDTNSLFDIDLIPYQPIGWDGPIVISTVAGTHTNAQTITTADTLYIDFAILNNGPDYVLFENFKYTLSLDGVLWGSVTKYPPFYTYPPILNQDSIFAPLSAGTHEITLTVDSENTVQETNENNNVFSKRFTVLGTTPPPTLSINDISINEGSSGVSIATFTVTLSTVATSNVTVNYATANGTGSAAAVAPDDYTSSSGSLTFTPGETSKTISVTIISDTVVEANETFFVNLSSATNAIIADNQGVGTILDDDSTPIIPTLAIAATNANLTEGNNSGTNPFTFTVKRDVNTTGANAVNWAVIGSGTNLANDSDFVGGVFPSGILNFAAGQTSKKITVNVQGDTTVEADENFTVTLSNPTNGATITTATAIGTIQNDDSTVTTPTLAIAATKANQIEKNSGTNPFTFTVKRDVNTTGANAVNWAVIGSGTNLANDSDYSKCSR